MKFTNPTSRKEYLRCPKRYYYRYLYEPGEDKIEGHDRRRQLLYGVRELGGHLIHRGAAEMVRAIASDNRSWNYEDAGRKYRDEFLLIVAKSMAAAPGEWIGGPQLAEMFNGEDPNAIRDDVGYWKELIPTAIENAWRATHPLQLLHDTSERRLEAEREVRWDKGGQIVRCKFDVLIQSKYQVTDIDWKTHEIDNSDLYQVRQYLDYLNYKEKVPVSKLHGFAVDLRREAIVRVKYEPFRLGRSVSLASILPVPSSSSAAPRDPYPAKSHPDLCQSCPYATLCPAAILPGASAMLPAVAR